MANPKRKRERLSGEERRAQIVDAALKVFAEKGFSGARTKEIAEQAGISETLIFQHFKTKGDLYRSALKELFSKHPVMPEVEEKMRIKDDLGVLRNMASHLIRHSRQDPRILRLALFSALEELHFGEIIRDGGDGARPTLQQFLGAYFQQRINDGAFKQVNALIAANLFIETVMMYAADQQASISGPALPVSDEEVIDTLLTVFLDGLKSEE
jgi:TetR/AcrR family transcriptional regulator